MFLTHWYIMQGKQCCFWEDQPIDLEESTFWKNESNVISLSQHYAIAHRGCILRVEELVSFMTLGRCWFTQVFNVHSKPASPTSFGCFRVRFRVSNWKWLVTCGTGLKCLNRPALYRTGSHGLDHEIKKEIKLKP